MEFINSCTWWPLLGPVSAPIWLFSLRGFPWSPWGILSESQDWDRNPLPLPKANRTKTHYQRGKNQNVGTKVERGGIASPTVGSAQKEIIAQPGKFKASYLFVFVLKCWPHHSTYLGHLGFPSPDTRSSGPQSPNYSHWWIDEESVRPPVMGEKVTMQKKVQRKIGKLP